eukprot:13459962-Alexandrium_andersonii.AAC.1
MSASLVGSEMCIRDSPCRCAKRRARRPGAGSGGSREWQRATLPVRSAGPVSYTHLTLPTICSV